MVKILNTDDLIEAATQLRDEGQIPNSLIDAAVDRIVDAQNRLAEVIAACTGVIHRGTSWEGEHFGGLCSTFRAGLFGEKPDAIAVRDQDGEW